MRRQRQKSLVWVAVWENEAGLQIQVMGNYNDCLINSLDQTQCQQINGVFGQVIAAVGDAMTPLILLRCILIGWPASAHLVSLVVTWWKSSVPRALCPSINHPSFCCFSYACHLLGSITSSTWLKITAWIQTGPSSTFITMSHQKMQIKPASKLASWAQLFNFPQSIPKLRVCWSLSH